MRKDLFLGFLGVWIAVVPFLFACGTTQTAALVASGIVVALLALASLRKSTLV